MVATLMLIVELSVVALFGLIAVVAKNSTKSDAAPVKITVEVPKSKKKQSRQ